MARALDRAPSRSAVSSSIRTSSGTPAVAWTVDGRGRRGQERGAEVGAGRFDGGLVRRGRRRRRSGRADGGEARAGRGRSRPGCRWCGTGPWRTPRWGRRRRTRPGRWSGGPRRTVRSPLASRNRTRDAGLPVAGLVILFQRQLGDAFLDHGAHAVADVCSAPKASRIPSSGVTTFSGTTVAVPPPWVRA